MQVGRDISSAKRGFNVIRWWKSRRQEFERHCCEQLGPIQLRCRGRTEFQYVSALGYPGLGFFGPPLIGLIMSLPFAFVVAKGLRIPQPMLKDPVAVALVSLCFFATTAFGYWWVFAKRYWKPLVLHSNGFRFGRRLVRFSELSTVQVGEIPSPMTANIQKVNQVLGYISSQNRDAAQSLENRLRNGVTLVFKDGTITTMLGVLLLYEADDVRTFFKTLASEIDPPEHQDSYELPNVHGSRWRLIAIYLALVVVIFTIVILTAESGPPKPQR